MVVGRIPVWFVAAAWSLLVPAQANEQLIETYRKASDHLLRGAYAESIRLVEDLVKARADKEGVLRVRVGAGLEDREFEPRRIAGDACVQLAKNAADLEARAKHLADAERWYQASSDLGLAKAAPLLKAARAERARVEKEIEGVRGEEMTRRKLETVKSSVAKLVSERSFESASAEVAKARPLFPDHAKAVDALKEDVDAAFRRWQEALLGELRQDLASFRAERAWNDRVPTAERYGRYRVPPERATASKLDPELGWAARFASLFEKEPLNGELAESLAEDGAGLSFAAFRSAQNLVLEQAASAVRDPGPAAALDDRWAHVLAGEAAFAAAATRARERVARTMKTAGKSAAADLTQWLREELPGYESRAAAARKSLPDREAPGAVASCLARLRSPTLAAGAKRDGYAGVDRELGEIAARAQLDPALRGELLAARAVARAHALLLDGLSREDVLGQCRDLLREAASLNLPSLEGWKGKVSPRIQWILDQGRP